MSPRIEIALWLAVLALALLHSFAVSPVSGDGWDDWVAHDYYGD